jgi:quinol monooxygenase YgiN
MIRVVAVITAKPGRLKELAAAFNANAPTVRAERGCVEYAPFVDAEGFGARQAPMGADALVILEEWADAQALKDHMVAPHMVSYSEKTRDLIASRAIHILSPF